MAGRLAIGLLLTSPCSALAQAPASPAPPADPRITALPLFPDAAPAATPAAGRESKKASANTAAKAPPSKPTPAPSHPPRSPNTQPSAHASQEAKTPPPGPAATVAPRSAPLPSVAATATPLAPASPARPATALRRAPQPLSKDPDGLPRLPNPQWSIAALALMGAAYAALRWRRGKATPAQVDAPDEPLPVSDEQQAAPPSEPEAEPAQEAPETNTAITFRPRLTFAALPEDAPPIGDPADILSSHRAAREKAEDSPEPDREADADGEWAPMRTDATAPERRGAPLPAHTAAHTAAPAMQPASQHAGLAIDFTATRFHTTRSHAVLRYRLGVTNRGEMAVGPVLIEAVLSAPPLDGLTDPANHPSETACIHRLEALAPGERGQLDAQLSLPLSEVAATRVGAAQLFVPVVMLHAEAAASDAAELPEGAVPEVVASSDALFMVGECSDPQDNGEEEGHLAPFRLDMGPRMATTLTQRALDAG